jgi:hypothetical protein
MEDRVSPVLRIQESYYTQHTGRTLIRNVNKLIQEDCALQTAQNLLQNARKYLPDVTASRIIRWQFLTANMFLFPCGFQIS